MRKVVVTLSTIIGLVLSAPSHGAVMFEASSGLQVASGANVSVQITVSDFADVLGFQFTLQWDPNVLQFSSVNGLGLPNFTYLDPDPGNGDNFGFSTGKLTVVWDNASPVTVNNASTIFAINYTVVGASGSESSIAFIDSPAPRQVTIAGIPFPVDGTFASTDGSVTVVPEPVTVALGVFTGLFVVTTTVRRILRRRRPQPVE
jgi:hypothetical protein